MSILTRLHEGILTVTINRPEVYNALDMASVTALQTVLHHANKNKQIRVVVMTGAGDQAFCAGVDIKQVSRMQELEYEHFLQALREAFCRMEGCKKPIIAAINGYCLGGGAELALACDLRIMSEKSKIGFPEVSLGMLPGAGGTQRLPRLIGRAKAMELIFTGQQLSAKEAQGLGLINHVSAEPVLDVAYELAGRIAQNAPLAISQAKQSIIRGCETDLASGLFIEAQSYQQLIHTKDRIEALSAFQQKRKPVFRGE